MLLQPQQHLLLPLLIRKNPINTYAIATTRLISDINSVSGTPNPKISDFGTPRQQSVRVGLGWVRERVPKSGAQKWYPLSATFMAPG